MWRRTVSAGENLRLGGLIHQSGRADDPTVANVSQVVKLLLLPLQ